MQPPGWYPDPSGQPQSFRFWDGQAWTPVTTRDPNTPWPTPSGPASDGSGAGPPRSKTPLLIGGAVLVLLAVITGVVLWQSGAGRPTRVPSSTAATTPSIPGQPSGAGTPSAAARLRCDNGNGNATNLRADSYSSTGLRYDAPPNFGFRFSKKYWLWADDFSAFGTVTGGQQAGLVLGGLSTSNGFGEVARAGEQVLSCMEGTFSRDQPTKVEGSPSTEPVDIGGMEGYRTTARMASPGESRRLLITVTVVDSGQPGKLAHLITFVREGDPAQSQVEQAAATLRRG